MQLNRRLISLLGVVVVAAVIVAGILLGAMPLYLESRATAKQAEDVAQTNQVYDVQVQALRKDAERIDEIRADLAALRAQIPASPQLDDVFALVNRAAESAGVRIQTAAAAEPEPWAARAAPGEDGEQPAPPATPAPPTGAADAGANPDAGEAAEAGETPGAAADAAGGGAAGAAPPPAATPETQVPITVIVVAGDTASAARFAEALGAGPRLLGITHATMTDTTEGYTLTLDALAFVRTEPR